MTALETADDEDVLVWEPPAKGDWRGLHDHFPRALTPEYQRLLAEGMTEGEAVWIERYGLPVKTIAPAFLHGRVFIAAEPLVGPRSDSTPPHWAMRLALAAVPSFRRRVKAAELAVQLRPWLEEARHWFEVEEDGWRRGDERLEAIDPATLEDRALLHHLHEVRAWAGEGYRTHFRLHGCDLIPTGMLLVRAAEWGLSGLEVAGLLAGSSPTSRGDQRPADWCMVTGYDLDERTAGELPDRGHAVRRPPRSADPEVEAELRARVPVTEQEEWDRLLADARATCGVRDANGLLAGAWPVGLLRRAMLEVGHRLVATGRLQAADHAVEMTVGELHSALEGGSIPSSADVLARARERRRLSAHTAPPSLGPPQDLPLGAMPPGMRTLAAALMGIRDEGLTSLDRAVPLHGTGIGEGTVSGRACVARDPAEALARFEPGDVLVTAGTCPAWNVVLAHAGGVVTEEGGPLSHAAVIARELGLPAIIGCAEALDHIPDGATVVLDLDAGVATVGGRS